MPQGRRSGLCGSSMTYVRVTRRGFTYEVLHVAYARVPVDFLKLQLLSIMH